jgi:hypothetical protein
VGRDLLHHDSLVGRDGRQTPWEQSRGASHVDHCPTPDQQAERAHQEDQHEQDQAEQAEGAQGQSRDKTAKQPLQVTDHSGPDQQPTGAGDGGREGHQPRLPTSRSAGSTAACQDNRSR